VGTIPKYGTFYGPRPLATTLVEDISELPRENRHCPCSWVCRPVHGSKRTVFELKFINTMCPSHGRMETVKA
jgi:hypothetical protein